MGTDRRRESDHEDVWWVDDAAGWLGVGTRDDEVECDAISVGELHDGLV